jgi:hypothetical protein
MIPASSLFCCRDHVRERRDKWTFSPGVALPRHNPRQLFLAMNSSVGFEFFSNLQAALAWLQQVAPVDTLARIYRRELRRGEGCPPRPGATVRCYMRRLVLVAQEMGAAGAGSEAATAGNEAAGT